MHKGSKKHFGPLFKMDGVHVTIVLDILHQVKVRKKLTSSISKNFKKDFMGR